MSLLFSIKKGAQLPSVEFALSSSVEFDIDDAETVKLAYWERDEDSKSRTVVDLNIEDADTKKVSIEITPELVAKVAVYQCQVELVFDVSDTETPDLRTMVIPQIDFDEFHVTPTIE